MQGIRWVCIAGRFKRGCKRHQRGYTKAIHCCANARTAVPSRRAVQGHSRPMVQSFSILLVNKLMSVDGQACSVLNSGVPNSVANSLAMSSSGSGKRHAHTCRLSLTIP